MHDRAQDLQHALERLESISMALARERSVNTHHRHSDDTVASRITSDNHADNINNDDANVAAGSPSASSASNRLGGDIGAADVDDNPNAASAYTQHRPQSLPSSPPMAVDNDQVTAEYNNNNNLNDGDSNNDQDDGGDHHRRESDHRAGADDSRAVPDDGPSGEMATVSSATDATREGGDGVGEGGVGTGVAGGVEGAQQRAAGVRARARGVGAAGPIVLGEEDVSMPWVLR